MSTASWKDALKEVQKPLPHMGKTWKNGWCHLGRIGGACSTRCSIARCSTARCASVGEMGFRHRVLGANILGSLVSRTSILLSTIAAESHRIAGFMIQPYPTYSFCRPIMPYFPSFCCLASPGTRTWRCEPIWCPTREPGRAGNTCHSSKVLPILKMYICHVCMSGWILAMGCVNKYTVSLSSIYLSVCLSVHPSVHASAVGLFASIWQCASSYSYLSNSHPENKGVVTGLPS